MNDELIRLVWRKGKISSNNNPNKWRLDDFGNFIAFSKHGDRDSKYGWEIDHIVPLKAGGSDHVDNLRPLNWKANLARNH